MTVLGSFLFKAMDKGPISSSRSEGGLWGLACWVSSSQGSFGDQSGEQRLICRTLPASEAVSWICIYVYGGHIYFLFLSPPPLPQAADFDMCSIVWSWVCHLCLHLLCGLLFEVSLVASSSWLCHHPICHLDGAHCYKCCSPIYTIM